MVADAAEGADGLPEMRVGIADETETSIIASDTGMTGVESASAIATETETGAMQEILGHDVLLSAGQGRQHEISEIESAMDPLELTRIGLDVAHETAALRQRAPHHQTPNSACRHTLAGVGSTVVAEEDEVIGLPIAVGGEDRIWTIEATVTRAAGLRKAAGFGNGKNEIEWNGWTDMEKQTPDATLETNPPVSVSYSGRKWRLAQTPVTRLRLRTRRSRPLQLHRQHQPLDQFRIEP